MAYNITAPVTNGASIANAPVLPSVELPAALKTLPDDVRAAILASNPAADTVTLTIDGGTKNRPTKTRVLLTVGRPEDWTPVFTADATHKVGSAAGKRNEYDEILAAGCAVRGGTVLAIEFGYRPDSMGFRTPNYRPVVQGLERAFFRVLDNNDARRIDRTFRVIANDVNAANQKDVAGYILVRITGYRVK